MQCAAAPDPREPGEMLHRIGELERHVGMLFEALERDDERFDRFAARLEALEKCSSGLAKASQEFGQLRALLEEQTEHSRRAQQLAEESEHRDKEWRDGERKREIHEHRWHATYNAVYPYADTADDAAILEAHIEKAHQVATAAADRAHGPLKAVETPAGVVQCEKCGWKHEPDDGPFALEKVAKLQELERGMPR